MRPGAGYLPTLALGRSRGGTTEPACADRGGATVGSTAGALQVTLLRSAPRRAYRIYSEEEFLAAEDWQVEVEPEFALLGQADPHRAPARWGRVAGLAALASVVATVVGVVALNATRSRSESDRRLTGRIAARGGPSLQIFADRSSVRPRYQRSRTRIRRAVAVRRVAERRPLPVGRPRSTHAYIPSQPPPPATTAISEIAGTTTTNTTAAATAGTAPVASTAAPAPAVGATAPTTVPAATGTPAGHTAAASGADSEFGFERR
jgi:hypothetical protein